LVADGAGVEPPAGVLAGAEESVTPWTTVVNIAKRKMYL
jgi:hypothetical protein